MLQLISEKVHTVDAITTSMDTLLDKVNELGEDMKCIKDNRSLEAGPMNASSYAGALASSLGNNECASPARKVSRKTASGLCSRSVEQRKSILPPGPYQAPVISTPDKSPLLSDSSVILKLGDATKQSNIEALKHLESDDVLSSKCSTKLSRDGSVNLLFRAYKDAVAVKEKLKEKFNLCDIAQPSVRNLKKIDLVGLPYEVSVNEAATSIVKNNPDLKMQVCALKTQKLCIARVIWTGD